MYNPKTILYKTLFAPSLERLPCPARKRQQQGVSLIELMVGITIGLLVILAAVGSLVFTQTTATAAGDSTRLQQKADNVFRNIGFHLTQAGAIVLTSNIADPAKVMFSNTFTGFDPTVTLAPPNQIFSIHGINGGGAAPDTLRVSYQDNGTVRDCLGNQQLPTANVRMDNTFSILGTDLMCRGGGAPPQSIADRVEDFQVTYGVQTFVVGVGGAAQYQFYRADQMLAFPLIPNWTSIQAVSICLQMASDSDGYPHSGGVEGTGALLATGCNGQFVVDDGRLHRVYQRTFAIRNALL